GDSNLIEVIKKGYSKDPLIQSIILKPKEHRNFVVENNLVYLKRGNGELSLCIPPNTLLNGTSLRELLISEAHSLLAHLGYAKTSAYLRDNVWWK
ncbi:hypothetical protein K435DRAFT_608375, partial [Dendrothele bispora CBS 962.96]